MPVFKIHHSTDKVLRVQTLQPLISAGTIRFSKRQVTLLQQLRQYPHGAHDDGPDALEMAVETARGARCFAAWAGGEGPANPLDDEWGWHDAFGPEGAFGSNGPLYGR